MLVEKSIHMFFFENPRRANFFSMDSLLWGFYASSEI